MSEQGGGTVTCLCCGRHVPATGDIVHQLTRTANDGWHVVCHKSRAEAIRSWCLTIASAVGAFGAGFLVRGHATVYVLAGAALASLATALVASLCVAESRIATCDELITKFSGPVELPRGTTETFNEGWYACRSDVLNVIKVHRAGVPR